MDARALAVFLGLAAVAGVALAARRDSLAAGGAVDAPAGEGGGEWGPLPELADEAAGYLEDAMQGVSGGQLRGMSWDGLVRLADTEGFSAVPYPDFKGRSIGFGHLIQPGENLAYVTRDDAMALLSRDVADAERAVRTAVTAPLTQNQFDALVSFAYNVGAGAFRKSTLVRKLNAGDYEGAAAEFPRWNMAGGKVLPALEARRAQERATFEA